jgi:hypothetical protein
MTQIDGNARRPVLRAILTDVQLWLPVGVLILGFGLLAFVRVNP